MAARVVLVGLSVESRAFCDRKLGEIDFAVNLENLIGFAVDVRNLVGFTIDVEDLVGLAVDVRNLVGFAVDVEDLDAVGLLAAYDSRDGAMTNVWSIWRAAEMVSWSCWRLAMILAVSRLSNGHARARRPMRLIA